jgi:hypothetical protein
MNQFLIATVFALISVASQANADGIGKVTCNVNTEGKTGESEIALGNADEGPYVAGNHRGKLQLEEGNLEIVYQDRYRYRASPASFSITLYKLGKYVGSEDALFQNDPTEDVGVTLDLNNKLEAGFPSITCWLKKISK